MRVSESEIVLGGRVIIGVSDNLLERAKQEEVILFKKKYLSFF